MRLKVSRRWAILQFPGSNCDHDAVKAISRTCPELNVSLHWHEKALEKDDCEVLIIPGGFSFGDYLRTGAIAKLSPAMSNLQKLVEGGLHVLGICNGFQILIEARMLPGFLHVNESMRFISKNVDVEISSEAFPWFKKSDIGKILKLPIAHGFGNFQVSKMDSSEVQPSLTYKQNPNGSWKAVAGVYRKMGKGSVMGLMPHPERASFEDLRLSDGSLFWSNAFEQLRGRA